MTPFEQGYYTFMKCAGIFTEEPGRHEKYMPWHGSAAGGVLGHVAGGKLGKGKWKLPAQVLGAVLGGSAGVHGGEALGRKMDKMGGMGNRMLGGAALLGTAGAGIGAVKGEAGVVDQLRGRSDASEKARMAAGTGVAGAGLGAASGLVAPVADYGTVLEGAGMFENLGQGVRSAPGKLKNLAKAVF